MNIGSLFSSLFEVKIFNPVPVFLLSQGFDFTVSEIVTCGKKCIDDSPGLDTFSEGIRFVGVFLFILKYVIIKKV